VKIRQADDNPNIRISTTSRARIENSIWRGQPIKDSDNKNESRFKVRGFWLIFFISMLSVGGYVYYDYCATVSQFERSVDLDDRTTNTNVKNYSIPVPQNTIDANSIRDMVASVSQGYIQKEASKNKKALAQIEQLNTELETLKKGMRDYSNQSDIIHKTEMEMIELKEKINHLVRPHNVNSSTETNKRDPDWAVCEWGSSLKLIEGNFKPTKGLGVTEKISRWISPSTSDQKYNKLIKSGAESLLLQTPKNQYVQGDCYPMDPDGAIVEVVFPLPIKLSGLSLYHLPIAARAEGRFSAPSTADIQFSILHTPEPNIDKNESSNGLLLNLRNFVKSENKGVKMSTYKSFPLFWNETDGHEYVPLLGLNLTDRVRIKFGGPMSRELDFICMYRIGIHGLPSNQKDY